MIVESNERTETKIPQSWRLKVQELATAIKQIISDYQNATMVSLNSEPVKTLLIASINKLSVVTEKIPIEIQKTYNEIPWTLFIESPNVDSTSLDLKIFIDDKLPKIHQQLIKILDR